MDNQADSERDDFEHRTITCLREWYQDPWALHNAMQKRFHALKTLCVTLSSGTKNYRVPNAAMEGDIGNQFVPLWDEIVILTMLNQLSVSPKFPVTVLTDIVSGFCDWLSCPEKLNWQEHSVETSLQHFEAQLLMFAALLDIKKDHFPHREPSEGKSAMEAAILNHVQFPSGHNNAEYHPDEEDLAAELKEQEEIFARMPLSMVRENVEHAKAQFQFIKNLSLPLEWPKTETWIADPTAFLTDFNVFVRLFESLVNFDHEIGSFFAKEPVGKLAWIIAIEFVPKVKAALAVSPLPVSIERLQRVLEIVATQDADDKIETEIFDEAGNKEGTRHTWRPRYTFTQKQALCREAEQILAGERTAIAEFVRLKSIKVSEQRAERRDSSQTVSGQVRNGVQADWQSVFGMPQGDASDYASDVAFYAKFPAELADQLAKDLMRFERASSVETEKEWLYWTDSPLTQQPTYYRLLASLLPECPVNFSTFGGLWDASKNKENAGARDALEAARAELRLFGLWLESSGLWNKRPDSEHGQPNVSSAVQCKIVLVTPEEVALKLQTRNIKISPKTLKNTYKAAWGPPDGKEGNAELFDWNRIQPIVEGQFEVEFAD